VDLFHCQVNTDGVDEEIEVDKEDEVAMETAVSAVVTSSGIRALDTRIVATMKNHDPLGLILTADSDFLVRLHTLERPSDRPQPHRLPRLNLGVSGLTLKLWSPIHQLIRWWSITSASLRMR
jgi:hypothetical protein